jgi:hypothetical protein
MVVEKVSRTYAPDPVDELEAFTSGPHEEWRAVRVVRAGYALPPQGWQDIMRDEL